MDISAPVTVVLVKVVAPCELPQGVKRAPGEMLTMTLATAQKLGEAVSVMRTGQTAPVAPAIMPWNIAKERGRQFYFTGVPCGRGHLCERYVSSRRCVQCCKEDRA